MRARPRRRGCGCSFVTRTGVDCLTSYAVARLRVGLSLPPQMADQSARTWRIGATTTALLLVAATAALAHDLFLKPERYRVAENSDVLVRVLNGTFSKSENSILRARLLDVSVVSPAGRMRFDTTAWSDAGDTSTLRVRTGAAGTYTVGASTKPSLITLTGKEFNEYLASDGVPDVLAARRRGGELAKPATERYSKHVKSLIQVGATQTEHFGAELGYPAELVPLENPYAMKPGETLRLRTLVDGRSVANQFVLFGGRTLAGERIAQRSARSDSSGVVRVPLRTRGVWYVKFIHMARLSGDTANYESKWASLTFELR